MHSRYSIGDFAELGHGIAINKNNQRWQISCYYCSALKQNGDIARFEQTWNMGRHYDGLNLIIKSIPLLLKVHG